MRSKVALVAALLGLFASVMAATKPASDLHAFSGEVWSVDLAAKTFTIKSGGKAFVFHYTDETKISSFNGYIRWSTVRPGQGAIVVMRLGQGNVGVAVQVRFQDNAGGANFLDRFSARTTSGETVSGIALSNYVAYEPPGEKFQRAVNLGNGHLGIFLLSVKPNGTVGNVKPLQSLGLSELDDRASQWLKKWRFRPNSVAEVRIPVAYSRIY